MENKEIIESIVKIIQPYARNTEALQNVSESSKFVDDLNINSSRLVDTVLKMEDEFDISIDDDEVDTLKTVGDAVKLIQSKKA